MEQSKAMYLRCTSILFCLLCVMGEGLLFQQQTLMILGKREQNKNDKGIDCNNLFFEVLITILREKVVYLNTFFITLFLIKEKTAVVCVIIKTL